MPSHYAHYLYERQNKSIIEDENGFATYYYFNDICYIEELYVKRDARKTGVARGYADTIVADAKAKKAKTLMGSVNLNTNGATDGMKCFLAYGMELQSADKNMIYLTKSLESL